jgi:hypothetical protein
MTKTSRILALIIILAGVGSEARAQSDAERGFFNINFGFQPSERSIANTETRTVYGETATISTSQTIGSGPIFDVGGGIRIRPRFAVGVSYSRFSSTSDGQVSATIPNPLFFNQPKTVTATQGGLVHTENGIHVQVLWFTPVTDKFDVAVSIGPSFIGVSQGVPVVAIPAGTQTIAVTTGTESGTAVGVNAGVDLTYLFAPRLGAGVFMRYAGGKLDLPSAPGLSVGGFQIGGGARIRF